MSPTSWKLSGGDIKASPGRFRPCSGGYGNGSVWPYPGRRPKEECELMENAFYNKENLNPQNEEEQDEG